MRNHKFRIKTSLLHRSVTLLTLIICCLLLQSLLVFAAAPFKPRIVVLTDISPTHVEPDDMESLIRLFVYADMFEIEGLVATTGWSSAGGTADWIKLIHQCIDAYEQDLPNLKKRSKQKGHLPDESRQRIGYWPSPGYLRSVTVVGSQKRGMEYIGDGNDSPGSELIIRLADEPDDRPIWVLAWGWWKHAGSGCLACEERPNAGATPDVPQENQILHDYRPGPRIPTRDAVRNQLASVVAP